MRRRPFALPTLWALGLIAAASAGAHAAPLRYEFTRLAPGTQGLGLDDSGHVVETPINRASGEFQRPNWPGLEGQWSVADGEPDGRLLVNFTMPNNGLTASQGSVMIYTPGQGSGPPTYGTLFPRPETDRSFRVTGTDMNARGDVVGYSEEIVPVTTDGRVGLAYGPRQYFLARADGPGHEYHAPTDLLPPGLGLTSVRLDAVNDLGQILGRGQDADGQSTAFILTPVPEPATWAVFGLVAAALGLKARRRSR